MYQLSFHPYAATVVFCICLLAAVKFNNYMIRFHQDQDLGTPKRRPQPIPHPSDYAIKVFFILFLFFVFTMAACGIYLHERNG